MNPLKSVGHFFAGIGKLLGKGVGFAVKAGLTDPIINLALEKVREIDVTSASNSEKREAVVAFLKSHGIPESIARLAVEFGVQLLKKEVNSL